MAGAGFEAEEGLLAGVAAFGVGFSDAPDSFFVTGVEAAFVSLAWGLVACGPGERDDEACLVILPLPAAAGAAPC
jgi:hypothetical protein